MTSADFTSTPWVYVVPVLAAGVVALALELTARVLDWLEDLG